MSSIKNYKSIEEFEREEIRSEIKLGWSLDDLYSDARLDRRMDDFESDRGELDFE